MANDYNLIEQCFPGALGGTLPQFVMPAEKVKQVIKFLDSRNPKKVEMVIEWLENSNNWPEDLPKTENGKYEKAYNMLKGVCRYNKQKDTEISVRDIMRVLGGNYNLTNAPASKEHAEKLREFKKTNNGSWRGFNSAPEYNRVNNRSRSLRENPGWHPDYDGKTIEDYIRALSPDFADFKSPTFFEEFAQTELKDIANTDNTLNNVSADVNKRLGGYARSRGINKSELVKKHTPYTLGNGWTTVLDVGHIEYIKQQLDEHYGKYGIFDIAGISVDFPEVHKRMKYISRDAGDPDLKSTADVLAKHFPNYHMSTSRCAARFDLTEEYLREKIASEGLTATCMNDIRRFARLNGWSYEEIYQYFDLDVKGAQESKMLSNIWEKESV